MSTSACSVDDKYGDSWNVSPPGGRISVTSDIPAIEETKHLSNSFIILVLQTLGDITNLAWHVPSQLEPQAVYLFPFLVTRIHFPPNHNLKKNTQKKKKRNQRENVHLMLMIPHLPICIEIQRK